MMKSRSGVRGHGGFTRSISPSRYSTVSAAATPRASSPLPGHPQHMQLNFSGFGQSGIVHTIQRHHRGPPSVFVCHGSGRRAPQHALRRSAFVCCAPRSACVPSGSGRCSFSASACRCTSASGIDFLRWCAGSPAWPSDGTPRCPHSGLIVRNAKMSLVVSPSLTFRTDLQRLQMLAKRMSSGGRELSPGTRTTSAPVRQTYPLSGFGKAVERHNAAASSRLKLQRRQRGDASRCARWSPRDRISCPPETFSPARRHAPPSQDQLAPRVQSCGNDLARA